jgi:hypothetical protein
MRALNPEPHPATGREMAALQDPAVMSWPGSSGGTPSAASIP